MQTPINATAKIPAKKLMTMNPFTVLRDSCDQPKHPTTPATPKHTPDHIPIPSKAIPSSSSTLYKITCSTTAMPVMMICHVLKVNRMSLGNSFSRRSFSFFFNLLLSSWNLALETDSKLGSSTTACNSDSCTLRCVVWNRLRCY